VTLDDLLHDAEVLPTAARAVLAAQLDSALPPESSRHPEPSELRARTRMRRRARAEATMNRLLRTVERNGGIQDRTHAERIQDYQRMLELREALAEAERMAAVGQTTASVAHQVGTPLNLISGHVQVLLSKPDLTPDWERRLRLVQEQIARVADSVRGLLEHSRRPGPASAIDPGALLESIADLIRPRLMACGVRLEQNVDDDLPPILGARDELEMALLNLVSNAIDAMPTGGDLQLGASLTGEAVRITVQDSGLGIAPDLLPRIFEPFVTTKAPGRGTGLGLSITRDVIARLGGVITAEPAEGGGTVFVITLPAEGRVSASNVDSAHR